MDWGAGVGGDDAEGTQGGRSRGVAGVSSGRGGRGGGSRRGSGRGSGLLGEGGGGANERKDGEELHFVWCDRSITNEVYYTEEVVVETGIRGKSKWFIYPICYFI